MTLTSSSQSSASSNLPVTRNPDETNSDDEATDSQKPINGDRKSPFIDADRLPHRRRNNDDDDKDGEGTGGGGSTGGQAHDGNSGGQMGNGSSGGEQSRPHRDSSDSSQNCDDAAGSPGPVSQLNQDPMSGHRETHLPPTNSSFIRKRCRSGKLAKSQSHEIELFVNVTAKSSRPAKQSISPIRYISPGHPSLDESTTLSSTDTQPPKSLTRRPVRKPRYLYDYCREY